MAQARQRSNPKDRRRRRRRRLLTMFVFVIATFGLAWFFESQATTTIIFVRHADTDLPAAGLGAPGNAAGAVGAEAPGALGVEAPAAASDPPLNARGKARAELLADFLQDIDVIASVDAIYATESLRTRQTAMPLAQRLELDVGVTDHYDYVGFMADVLSEHKGRIVLVVTEGDAIAPLVEELHGSKNVPEIGQSDYDNLYIVTVPWFAKVKTLRLRYALGWDRQFELHPVRQGIPE